MEHPTPAIPLEFVERCQAHLERTRELRAQLATVIAEHTALEREYMAVTGDLDDWDPQYIAWQLCGLAAASDELGAMGAALGRIGCA